MQFDGMLVASEEQIRWFRLRRSGLVEPWPEPEAAATALGGIQAQILSAAGLALWNRSRAGADTESQVTERLFETRSLVRLWGQRRTLHLYASTDWPLINSAFSVRRTWWEKSAAKDASFDLGAFRSAVERVSRLLQLRGSLSRQDVRKAQLDLPPELLSPWGGVFAELVRLGLACHARWDGGEARYASREHWLPGLTWQPPTADAATLDLARRYFHSYGPASLADFIYWRGAGHVARESWWSEFQNELTPVASDLVPSERRPRYVLTADIPMLNEIPPEPANWPVRLLGRFDPLLLAHRDKNWVVPDNFRSHVWRPAGHIEAVVLAGGRVVATWRYERIGAKSLAIRVLPFRWPLPAPIGREVRRLARGVARFFGLRLSGIRIERRPRVGSSSDRK